MKSLKDRRFYIENEKFVAFENPSSVTPVLISCDHVSKIPFNAFEEMKKVCAKLYGDRYCFAPSDIEDVHYQIKVVRFSS